MPELERTITVDTPVTTVWTYLKDFTHTEEWDPPTVRTERVSGDGGAGTRYHNVSKVLGRETEIEYVVTECVEEQRLQLRGDAGSVDLLDTMTFAATPQGGTSLTYHLEFTPRGVAKLATPILPAAFARLADSTAAQLERSLQQL